MAKYILEARRFLPSDLPEGSVIKIPVSLATGQFVTADQLDRDSTIVFYGFLKNDHDWDFLGRGLTAC